MPDRRPFDLESAAIGWRLAQAGDEQDAANWAYDHIDELLGEIGRLQWSLSRAADAPCSHCSAEWRHGERNTAHFIAGQVCLDLSAVSDA